MTEEQAYAAVGRKAVEYAKRLAGDEFCPCDSMDDCTIKILGMADMLDEMDRAGAFRGEAEEREPTYRDRDRIWWRDSEVCKPETHDRVLVTFRTRLEGVVVASAHWLDNHWECYLGESVERLTIPMHWAPLNLPEED